MTFRTVSAYPVRLVAVLCLLLCIAVAWPGAAQAQHTSALCAPKTATVASGGSVVIDVTDCAQPLIFAGDGVVDGPKQPDRGSATLRITASQWLVDYVHFGQDTATDTFEFSDTDGGTVRTTVTVTPPASSIVVAPGNLPGLVAGTSVNQQLTASGGSEPYTFALVGAAAPGLTLSSTGLLSGVPTQRGTYNFTVRATDNLGASVDKTYSGTVQNPSLSLVSNTATLLQNAAFNGAVSATGGVAPYAYALEAGALPPGITLSGTGTLSGITTAAAGNYPVTLRVTDASTGPGSYFETESFTVVVSAAPIVTLAVSPVVVLEDSGLSLVYTVTRDVALSSPTTVSLSYGGSATLGVDYSGAATTVVIPAGATSASVSITPTADGVVEADETVIVTAGAGSGYTVGAPASATGTILNDDVPRASVSVAPASVAENSGTALVYTVTLDRPSNALVQVNYALSGTATAGTDYTAPASPLQIAAGQLSATVTVTPTDDTAVEGNETVTLALSTGTGYALGSPTSATATIIDNDLPQLSIGDVSLSEGDSGITLFAFVASLDAPAGPGGVNFDVLTSNGTALAGSDYVAFSGNALIPAGASNVTVLVQVLGDTLNEADETFFVNLLNVTGAAVADGQGAGTIVNDDALPALSIADVAQPEGNSGTTAFPFTVSLSAASGRPVTVNYATANGTAVAGTDYVAGSGTLTFAPGVTTQTVNVMVNGNPLVQADRSFGVTLSGASNATLARAQGTATIVDDDVPVQIITTVLPAGQAGAAYSQTIQATGGTGTLDHSVVAGALPDGLTLANDGTLSGTPRSAGTFNLTVRVADTAGNTADQPYALTIALATLSFPAIGPQTVARGESVQIANGPPSGGVAPYAWSISAGALPPGLSLDLGTGEISGTPTALGAYNYSLTLRDSTTGVGPASVTAANTITVVEPVPVAGPVSLALAYNAGPTPVTLVLSGGSATAVQIASGPSNGSTTVSGLSVTYTPTTGFAGVDSFTYTASNANGVSAPATVTVTVAAPTLSAAASGSLAATVGQPYSQTFTWSGGNAPYGSQQVANLPAGVTVSATTATSVTISGTPTAAGSYALLVSAIDSSTGTGPFAGSSSFTLVVSGPVLTLSPAAGALPPSTAGVPWQQTFTAGAGIAPYSYSATGALPPGLTLDAGSGQLAGTPSAGGSYTFTVTATDSTGGTPASISQTYTVQIAAPLLVLPASGTVLPAQAGTAFLQQLGTTGGIAPYRYSVAGILPAGISLDAATGLLSGTPTEAGSFAVTVTVTDSTAATPATASAAYTLQVDTPTLSIGATPLAEAMAARAYEHTFTAAGGIAPYRYSVTGALPAGLALDAASGVLSGTPTQSGSFAFTLAVQDSTGGTPATASQAFSLTVNAPTLVVAPVTNIVPLASAGSPYTATFEVSGGIAPYRFGVSGALPAGVSLDAATGVLSGTPGEAGSFTFTVTVTDSTAGTPASASLVQTLQVAAPTLAMTPAAGTLAQATAGQAYQQTFSSSGGIAPYTYVVSDGALPAGLQLDAASGQLAGTPAGAGDARFSITVTDSTGGTAARLVQTYSLSVVAPVLTLTPETLPAGLFGRDYQTQLSATGGTAPYRYSVSAGALPAGLTLEQGGRLAGVPTAGGSFSVTFTATDANGFTGLRAYVVQIEQRPDPTRDAEVRGLLDAQADTARRFARSQIENFQQRMQRLHGAARNGGFSNNLSLSASSQRDCDRGPGVAAEPECDRQRRRPFDAERTPDAPSANAGQAQDDRALGLWIGGNVRSGRTGGGRGAGTDFESDGLTVGSDYRLSDALVIGAGVGYGKDRSDVGQVGSRSDGQAWTMAVYGSYSPGQRVFVDMLVGHQLLDYTLRRHVTADGSFVHGRRDGQQWFGSLSLGADFGDGPWQFTPYARLDASHGELDAYGEQGNSVFGLVYGNQDVRATTGNAGLRMAWRNARPWGGWQPNLQVEYQHDFSGSGNATLQYADMLEVPFYRTTLDGFERNRWMLGAGVQFDFRRHWGLRVDYRGLVGSDDRDHGVHISLDKQL